MSDLIRMIGMSVSHNGTCRKCGQPRDKADHHKCDRWPVQYGVVKGFHYTGNSRETDLAEFMRIATLISACDDPKTSVRFDIRIMQVDDAGPEHHS